MTVQRWIFEDLEAGETYTHPINPREAGSPFAARTLTFAQTSAWSDVDHGLQRTRAFEAPAAPADWSFGGVIRTQEHHDALLAWSKKSNEVRVSDHLGRTFEVIIRSFRPVERRATPATPWRMTYTMQVLVLRRLA